MKAWNGAKQTPPRSCHNFTIADANAPWFGILLLLAFFLEVANRRLKPDYPPKESLKTRRKSK
jgi:hypothetical protein